jgi:dehydrogenase/reductase SDR family member 1
MILQTPPQRLIELYGHISSEDNMRALSGQIALVTGASRGVGKGIAQALGAAGATVYITGRTERPGTATVPLPGTIHETAALVTQAGGAGIAIRCDHADDQQVKSVFDQIAAEQGRLDLLVNNAWAGYQAKQRGGKSGFKTPFWNMPPAFWDTMHTVGVRSHYVASLYAAAMMVPVRSGLIIHVSALAGQSFSDNVAYGVSKAAVDRMAADMAHQLRPHNVAVVSLCPSIVATEMIMARRKSQKLEQWMESPEFVGRAVVAIASDPAAMRRSGQVCMTRALAAEYGFSDIDGHQPKWEPTL